MIFFGKNKIDRVLKSEKIEKHAKEAERLPLEKGDAKAMFIAALIIFIPLIMVFILAILAVYWLFIGRF